MLHSVVIPHRDRFANLELCLWSLGRAMANLPRPFAEAEVLIVHQEATPGDTRRVIDARCLCRHHVRVVVAEPSEVFNKSRLLNIGLGQARGEAITFLDADALVGAYFFEGIYLADLGQLTRLCYRVRTFGDTPPPRNPDQIDAAFARYPFYTRAYEAYCNPDFNPDEGREPSALVHPVFGNSQFSITRERLAALGAVFDRQPTVPGCDGRPLLAYDEGYEGRGFEDLDYIQAIWHASDMLDGGYKAAIFLDADYAMFHLPHPYSQAWDPTETVQGILHRTAREANRRRYKDKWP